MSIDNFNFLRDLEQIVERQREGAELLKTLAEHRPDYTEDFRQMQEKTCEIAADLEEMMRREQEKKSE